MNNNEHFESFPASDNGSEAPFELRKSKLIEFIHSAFKAVRLGDGIGLLEGDAMDMCTDKNVPLNKRVHDERYSWKNLQISDLDRHHYATAHTDSAGFRFLIPAFMLANLQDASDGDYALECLMSFRSPLDRRTQALDCNQVQCIVEFLRFFRNGLGCDFYKSAIDASLDLCWIPILERCGRE